jgi:hypothetical protein
MSSEMIVHEYLATAAQYAARQLNQRLGQAYMNVLHDARPSLYRLITNTWLDPFHQDELFEAFLDYVLHNWDDPTPIEQWVPTNYGIKSPHELS